ncbi:MAG TPA: amidophosphoribosyltransferase [Persephonella sp.]|uniref:Amidophosphoribosyltransferase n=1 Tax=Persephonella marina (strain DSM 14350 / EX-H1) TaxID=123214 RepID=C0QQ41_PERMH|nr:MULTISPECIES: amidophosphoribosyltransferase [Persephonella]ACO03267.1 amidophosphoribosyltransferase [Persephonella marina EX-H1]HCB69598.1 amidophosphoribosyltransferase [Persephonella sp.]
MCGVFGVFNNSLASHMTFLGLHALQHRGQESAGIAVSDGYDINLRTGEGLVTKALKEKDLQELKGDIAIGHVRYSTAGGSNPKNIQPFFAHFYGGSFAIAHNGNLVNAEQIREDLEKNGAIFRSTSDTEVFIHLIAKAKEPPPSHIMLHENDRDFLPLIFSAMNKVKGAYSLLILREKQLIAVRDPYGFRPLVLGKNRSGSYFIASETCALDIVDAEYLRDIKPGEVFVIDDSGMRSYFPLDHADNPRKCIFEFVYFARPDSMIFQDWVYEIRKEMGRTLAREFKVDADYVVPVLDSGLLAAKGYSEESGIPLEIGLIRNHYVGRSFIQPKQEIRDLSVKLKLNPVRQVVEGKRLVVIDDSLVRGTTSKKIVNMLRKAGAKEIHFLLSSPPVISPCYYGIDTPTKEELIAANMSIEQIRDYIGVDSLYYLSLEGMIGAANKFRQKGFCTACFTGNYPVF